MLLYLLLLDPYLNELHIFHSPQSTLNFGFHILEGNNWHNVSTSGFDKFSVGVGGLNSLGLAGKGTFSFGCQKLTVDYLSCLGRG